VKSSYGLRFRIDTDDSRPRHVATHWAAGISSTLDRVPRISIPTLFRPQNVSRFPADVTSHRRPQHVDKTRNSAKMPSSNLPTYREFVTQLLNSLRALPRPSADASPNTATTNPLVNAPEPVKKQLLALHVLFPNELLPALDLLDRRLVLRFSVHRERDYRRKENAPPTQAVAELESTASLRGHGLSVKGAVAQSDDDRLGGASKASASAYSTALTHTAGQIESSDLDMVVAAQTDKGTGLAREVEEGTPRAEERSNTAIDTIYYVRSAQQRSSRFSTSYDSTTSYEVRVKAWNCSCPAFAFSAFPSIHPEPSVPVFNSTEPGTTSYASDYETADQDRWEFGGMSLGETTAPVCKHLLACVLVERCASLFSGFVEERDVSVEEAAGWAAGWGD